MKRVLILIMLALMTASAWGGMKKTDYNPKFLSVTVDSTGSGLWYRIDTEGFKIFNADTTESLLVNLDGIVGVDTLEVIYADTLYMREVDSCAYVYYKESVDSFYVKPCDAAEFAIGSGGGSGTTDTTFTRAPLTIFGAHAPNDTVGLEYDSTLFDTASAALSIDTAGMANAIEDYIDTIGDPSTYGNIDLVGKVRFMLTDTSGTDSTIIAPFADTVDGEPSADDVYAWNSTDHRWEIKAQTGGAGEANTASNLGSVPDSIFKVKAGVDLQFYGLKDSTGIIITKSGDTAYAFNFDPAYKVPLATTADSALALGDHVLDTADLDVTAVGADGKVLTTSGGQFAWADDDTASTSHLLERAALDDSITVTTAKIPTATLADSATGALRASQDPFGNRLPLADGATGQVMTLNATLDSTYWSTIAAGSDNDTSLVLGDKGDIYSRYLAEWASATLELSDDSGTTMITVAPATGDSLTVEANKIGSGTTVLTVTADTVLSTKRMTMPGTKTDTVYISDDVIVDFAGDNLSVTDGVLSAAAGGTGAKILNDASAYLDSVMFDDSGDIAISWRDGGAGDHDTFFVLHTEADHDYSGTYLGLTAQADDADPTGTALAAEFALYWKLDGSSTESGTWDLAGLTGLTLAAGEIVETEIAQNTLDSTEMEAAGIEIGNIDTTGYIASRASEDASGNDIEATYLTGNETITLIGDATGSGATSIDVTINDSLLSTPEANLIYGTIAGETWTGTHDFSAATVDFTGAGSATFDAGEVGYSELTLTDQIVKADTDTTSSFTALSYFKYNAAAPDSALATEYYVRKRVDTLIWHGTIVDYSGLAAHDTIPIAHLDAYMFPSGATIHRVGVWAVGGSCSDTLIFCHSTGADFTGVTVIDTLKCDASTTLEESSSTSPTVDDYVWMYVKGNTPAHTGRLSFFVAYTATR